MTDHVYRKFADQIESIQTLLQKDAAFAEICADYEEICTWLASHNRTQSPSTDEFDQARELVRDLENEIEQSLRQAGL